MSELRQRQADLKAAIQSTLYVPLRDRLTLQRIEQELLSPKHSSVRMPTMASPTTLQERRRKLVRDRDYLRALHTAGEHWRKSDIAELEAIEAELAQIDAQQAAKQ